MDAEFKMKITGRSYAGHGGNGKNSVTLEGTAEEIGLVEAMMRGLYWITTEDGKLVKWRHHLSDDKPPSIPDPILERYWPEKRMEYAHLKEGESPNEHDDPSIYVHYIYGYSGKESYDYRAELLRQTGFICLRSQREENGQYWEIWYLPGVWMAKRELKDKTTKEIVDWLCKNIRPGNIEVVGEKWDLCHPD